ncbi:MAG: hypothetical protein KY468_18655 [Armatimonadetes bacterium]|nr:hypothetical protein [Armatimonadota bacterium]
MIAGVHPKQLDSLARWRLPGLQGLVNARRDLARQGEATAGPPPRDGRRVANAARSPGHEGRDPNANKPEVIARCKEHLMAIHRALIAYQEDHHALPAYLSDLHPRYLRDEGVFLCEADRLRGKSHWGTLPAKADLRTSYVYEFSAAPVGPMHIELGPEEQRRNSTATWHGWKSAQIPYFGDMVPVVRCRNHHPMLSLTRTGRIFESEADWENSPLMIPEVLQGMERDLSAGVERFRSVWSLQRVAVWLTQFREAPGPEEIAPEELKRRCARVAERLQANADAFPPEERIPARLLAARLYLTAGREARAEALLAKLAENEPGRPMSPRAAMAGPRPFFTRQGGSPGGGMGMGQSGGPDPESVRYRVSIDDQTLRGALRAAYPMWKGGVMKRQDRSRAAYFTDRMMGFTLDPALEDARVEGFEVRDATAEEVLQGLARAAGARVVRKDGIIHFVPLIGKR